MPGTPPSRRLSEKEDARVETAENVTEGSYEPLSKQQRRRLDLNIDIRVVTMMGIILGISIIDRVNIGSAKVLGMDHDLGTDLGSSYSVCLLLFFPGYFLAEVPSNIMLAKIGVKAWMSFITFGFGLCVMCMGFVTSWRVLAFLRFVLGLFEGGIFPACVFLLSSWYTRYKLHRRMSVLYAIGTLSAGFGGTLAYGLGQLSGTRGMLGWRWVFIIEGVASMVIGLLSYFFLTDFPDKAKFMTPSERRVILAELEEDSGGSKTETLSWKLFKEHCGDWFLWVTTLIFMCVVVPTYGLGFFTPTILVGLGYSGLDATLYSAPPYAAAVGMLLVTAWLGDKFRIRGPLIIFLAALTLTGMMLVRPNYSSEIRYMGVFFAVMGVCGNQTSVLSFAQNNIVGSSKRLLFSALNIAGGAIGGIIGSTVFRSQDSPSYAPGLYTVAGLQVLMIVLVSGTMMVLALKNRRADRNNEVINGLPGWRHTL